MKAPTKPSLICAGRAWHDDSQYAGGKLSSKVTGSDESPLPHSHPQLFHQGLAWYFHIESLDEEHAKSPSGGQAIPSPIETLRLVFMENHLPCWHLLAFPG